MKKQIIDSAIGLSTLLLVLGIAGTIFLAPASPNPVVACNATSCAAQTTQYKQASAATPTPAYVAAAQPEDTHVPEIQQPVPTSVPQAGTPESTPAPTFQPEPTATAQIQPLPTATISQPQTETQQPQGDNNEDTREPQEQQKNVVEQTLQPVNTVVSGVTSLLK